MAGTSHRRRRSHHPTALQLGDLAHDPTDRPRGAGDEHGLTRLRAADVEQAEVGGHPRHAQRPQIHGQGRQGGVHLQQRAPRDHAYSWTPSRPVTCSPTASLWMPGGDHLAGAERPHDLADAHRRDVGASVVHPAAHGRVQREVAHLHHDLALPGIGDRLLDIAPVTRLGETHRACGKLVLVVHCVHFGCLSSAG